MVVWCLVLFCYAVLSVPSIFSKHLFLLRKRELVAFHYLSFCCVYSVVGGLQYVLVFPGQLTFWSFQPHVYYNQNRSALLCKVMSDNSLLAVNSVNTLSMGISIADLI